MRALAWKIRRNRPGSNDGFSFIELLVVLVTTSIVVVGLVGFFTRQQKMLVGQRLVADVQSMGTIGFFLIGRDIRRAGSNPNGALTLNPGTPIPFGVAETNRIQILTDLNGDQDVDDEDEDITYEFVDSDGDTILDRVVRNDTTGNDVFIDNVAEFSLSYIVANGTETTTPSPISLVRKVRVVLGVESARNDPTTNQRVVETYEQLVTLRNFN